MANTYNMNLVTGARGEDHVTSADDGSLYASIYGRGQYVMYGFSHSLVNSGLIRISEGDALINGRHCRINHGYVADLDLASGSNGLNRVDLVVISYRKTSATNESATLEIISGTATSGTAAQPSYTSGNILNGDSLAQFPLYKISYTGVNTPVVTKLFSVANPLIDMYNELRSMIIPPIGSIEENTTGTNPSTRYPGTTWSLYGVGQFAVCYNASDTDFSSGKTGGAKTKSISIGVANLPSHSHKIPTHGHASTISGSGQLGTYTDGGHTHLGYTISGPSGSGGTRLSSNAADGKTVTSQKITASDGSHAHSIPSHTHTISVTDKAEFDTKTTGSGTAISLNVLPPYVTLYRWKRTA